MLSRFPGVLIGRLAVSKKYKHQGVGSQVLKFLKFWFAEMMINQHVVFL